MSKQNGLHCFNCDKTIFSESRHDFRTCNCDGNKMIYVDGGLEYFRIGIGVDASYEVVSRDING